jgi:hypothetical protein
LAHPAVWRQVGIGETVVGVLIMGCYQYLMKLWKFPLSPTKGQSVISFGPRFAYFYDEVEHT